MAREVAGRLKKIPPYLFADIEARVRAKRAEGLDIIDFGIGDPDIPTPKEIVEELRKQVKDPANHQYANSQGEMETRRAVAEWYMRRFGVDVDPEREVVITMGSKEGLVNMCRAFVNPGEKVLVPDPAYPVYAQGGTYLSEGVPERTPLLPRNGFLLDIDSLPTDGKMVFVNYPNNPTGAVASKEFLKRVVDWGRKSETIVCYDNAYSEITFDDYLAPSILEIGRDCIEFGSLSKTFNMTGYRIGFAVGDADLVAGLKRVKSQVDSGVPKFIQKAAIKALSEYECIERPPSVERNCEIYKGRRDALVAGLRDLGFKVTPPLGTFYLWFEVGGASMEFAKRLLEVGVVVTPGVGFGEYGEGYVRMALTQPVDRIEEALKRMKRVLLTA
ncbi:MAG: aminotransferase class I/II-fold pyridoxal phosphate-dependent enzyme [Euryarchaeota archaeon]|nr:aminotransferase class I/II-fold pyridoxal phosphate-dependent enzyme [Euryarchaeota archaeon]